MRQYPIKKLEADNAKGLNETLAELAVMEERFGDAWIYYMKQAELNESLGIPAHRQWDQSRKYKAIHDSIQAFLEEG